MFFIKFLIGWMILGFLVVGVAGPGGLIMYFLLSLGGLLISADIIHAMSPSGKEQNKRERIRDEEIANQYIDIDYLDNFDD